MKLKEIENMKLQMVKKVPKIKSAAKDFVSSGSTMVNMGCTGKPNAAFAKGGYYLFVGDSTSGKTFICHCVLAEAANNPNFDDYDLIYDDVENGALMDVEYFYGKKLARRIKAPAYDKDKYPIYSSTVEDMYYGLDDAFKRGRPFIWIEDSMDSLSSKAAEEKFEKQKLAYRKGRKEPGSYGDGKAKINSEKLRQIINKLKKTGSILIIVCQTRDLFESFGFETKTRSGGHALKFYANLELWTSVAKTLKKKIKDVTHEQGIICKVQIKKNRVTGKRRSALLPIYHSHGVDDIGSCVDWLIAQNHWKKSNGLINAKELDIKASYENLISEIEEQELELELKCVVKKVWDNIEEAIKVKRKRKYE